MPSGIFYDGVEKGGEAHGRDLSDEYNWNESDYPGVQAAEVAEHHLHLTFANGQRLSTKVGGGKGSLEKAFAATYQHGREAGYC